MVSLILVAQFSVAFHTRADDLDSDPVAAVRAVLTQQAADWNKRDLDGFLGGYWNSPKLVFQSGGHRVDGWETVRDRYRARYQSAGRAMGRLQFAAFEIEPLAPAVVLARGSWSVTMPDGSNPRGLFTLVFRRLPQGWKIVHDHTSADEAASPPTVSGEKKGS